MPDTGTLVSDADVKAFIPNMPASFGAQHIVLIKGVEAKIKNYLSDPLTEATYTREEYTIAPPIVHDGVLIKPRDQFRVKHIPISAWSALEEVTARDATTGAISVVNAISRNAYYVEMDSGIIRLLDPQILNPFAVWPNGSFPSGEKVLAATYTAGYAIANVPQDIKLVVLAMISRLFLQEKNNRWDTSSAAFEGQQIQFKDGGFTEEEMALLAPYLRGVFDSPMVR